MYRVADGEYRRWLKVTVRSLGLLIDWNWDASVQRKVRGLAVSGPVVLVTANLFTWLFEHSNITISKLGAVLKNTKCQLCSLALVSYVLRRVFGILDVYVWADVSWKEASHDGAGGCA